MIVDQLDCGEKISGEFVVARGDATEMLEFVEEARSRTWGREFHQSSGNLSAHCGALALAPKRPETRRRQSQLRWMRFLVGTAFQVALGTGNFLG